MSRASQTSTRRVVELACRAPSVHNTQPWRWRVIDDTTIELHADRTRQLAASDPSGRNLALSCGAALHHGSVAATALGLTPAVELEPAPEDRDLLARITLSPGTRVVESAKTLQALEDRCTDRRRFTSWPVPDSRLLHLSTAARGWGAHAFPITSVSARFCAETLVKEAMVAQASDVRIVEERRLWIQHSDTDGMPVANAAPAAHGRPPTRANRFAPVTSAGGIATAEAAHVVEGSDGLIAICSAQDDQRSWLEAGQVLSAVWLRATHEGLSIVPLSQVIEVDATREALHQKVFDGLAIPQILLRVGWLEATRERLPRTARRPLDDVIEH